MKVNAPARFPGSEAERQKNRDSHRFYDERCADCDCRPWGRAAEWPCGASVPRADLSESEGAGYLLGFAAGAWAYGSAA